MVVVAGMIFAFNVSSIRETMLEMNENQNKQNKNLQCINRYMTEKSVSVATQIRVREYLEYRWVAVRNRDRDQEKSLIDVLPPELRE